MAYKTNTDDSYDRFSASLKAGEVGRLYIFHGEERYLLEHSLHELRRRLCPGGLDGFNYKRFDGKDLTVTALDEAIEASPVFADRTFIEIHDYDVFKGKKGAESSDDGSQTPAKKKKTAPDKDDDKAKLAGILSNLPDYVCVAFLYDTLTYKPDGRLKIDKEILQNAEVVAFNTQEQSRLTKWITRHFEAAGKHISRADTEYLALITDGYMATLIGEIAKITAYSDSETVTRSDIDAVVTPVLSAIAYKLTDAIIARKYKTALSILDELYQMREPAHKILFSISLKMRQLLAARVCIDNKLSKKDFMEMCGIRYDFQATILLDTARRTTLDKCADAVMLCSHAAFDLNSSTEPESRLVELILQLAHKV